MTLTPWSYTEISDLLDHTDISHLLDADTTRLLNASNQPAPAAPTVPERPVDDTAYMTTVWQHIREQQNQLPAPADTTTLPAYGPTPPVPQPDRRIVPAWAMGTAVAGIGVGATCVGLGCGTWLACQGFAAVSLTSVLFVTLPIAALAAVAVAVGSAIRSATTARTQTHHHYTGPVHQEQHHTHTTTRGVWAKTNNQQ
ncbi:hypothetical protein ACF09H_38640 [Streptomyces sp. NPDC014983]|uniref:hypothetical protein n=1 Tax=Streptomyces sp. NPDC014983 TaxID=3364933 RepID=UPI0036F72D14